MFAIQYSKLAAHRFGQAEVERIRRARHSKGDQHPKKKVKKDKTFFIPGEVIDLT